MKFRSGSVFCSVVFTVLYTCGFPVVSFAKDCSQTSVGFTPLNDLGSGLYLGQFEGGLYAGGMNVPPVDHDLAGLAAAQMVQPLDINGQPSPDGHYILLSIGMSNTTQEFCSVGGGEPCDPWTFMGQAADNPLVNHQELVIINGARGGQAAATWDNPADQNYDRVRDDILLPRGLSEAQVQVVWVKQADPVPHVSLPDPAADAYQLRNYLADIARAVRVRYPNSKIIFFSSRIYAGYADTNLNPEPYAYESGFAVKWVIDAQVQQMAGGAVDPDIGDLNYATAAPWLAWGPYLWADGINPRSDGLVWLCDDMQSDGTHPARDAEEKVGAMLLDFMLNSPYAAPWFRAENGQIPGDLDNDGDVDQADLGILLSCYEINDCGDIDGDGDTDQADLGLLLANYTG